jgi:hypothetical protein
MGAGARRSIPQTESGPANWHDPTLAATIESHTSGSRKLIMVPGTEIKGRWIDERRGLTKVTKPESKCGPTPCSDATSSRVGYLAI